MGSCITDVRPTRLSYSMHLSWIVIVSVAGVALSEVLAEVDQDKGDNEGLIGMVRSVTKNVPANLAVGPFNIDTRNYANTLVNLCCLLSAPGYGAGSFQLKK